MWYLVRKLSKYLLFFNSLLIAGAIALPAAAEMNITDITISKPHNGIATITWNTSEPTKSDVYFGTSSENLIYHVGNIEFKVHHEADLTGLRKKTDYYYKIIATNSSGQRVESFVQYFNTDKMKDSVAPEVSGLRVLQTIDTAAAIHFFTNEPSRVNIFYGFTPNKLDKRRSDNSLRYEHLIIIDGLKSGSKYYFSILVKDEDDNTTERSGEFTTDAYHNYGQINISNLVPQNANQAIILPEAAVISWDSNVLATSEIVYGTDPDHLNKRLSASKDHQLSHRVELTNLNPNTVYYFKVKMSSNLNHKSFESQVYSFKTAPLTLEYLRQYFKSGDILKYGNDYYYLYNQQKIKLNNNSLTSRGYNKSAAKPIADKYFTFYKEGPAYWGAYHDGQVVKFPKKVTVYVIDGQYKRPLANEFVLKFLNYKTSDIIIDKDGNLNNYKNGAVVEHSNYLTGKCPLKNYSLAKSPNGTTVYLIANGRKMPFVNQKVFLQYGFKFSNVKVVEWGILGRIPDGQPII